MVLVDIGIGNNELDSIGISDIIKMVIGYHETKQKQDSGISNAYYCAPTIPLNLNDALYQVKKKKRNMRTYADFFFCFSHHFQI